MSRSRTFLGDDRAGEGNALAAFGLAAERAIGLAGALSAGTRRFPYFPFPQGIANAHDHRQSLDSLAERDLVRLRAIRKAIANGLQAAARQAAP